MIKIGDYVTRYKYNNDCLFKVIDIKDNLYLLTGVNIRLYATAYNDDLKIEEKENRINDEEIIDNIDIKPKDYREDYFYLPGKILHIDADKDYLNRCLKYYKKMGLTAYGILSPEKELPDSIINYVEEVKPDILVITGHDVYNKQKNEYKNSKFFEKSVEKARKYEKSYEKLKIISGACQSDFYSLIKSGSNFASSPKKVNVHALDPAILASIIALTENTKELDLIDTLSKTKSGPDGFGGIKCYGSMFVGYPK
ncbi:MAG: sporulation peptidase YabG [Bacilli bacterium]|nr:sporulation peptidase YabG [Bacilli bacterium]